MSNFTPKVKFETGFDGDQISMQLRRLKQVDAVKVAPYMIPENDGTVKMSFENQLKFTEVMLDLLPNYIEDFQGLFDADGNVISLEDAIAETYFQELIGRIAGRLMAISSPEENEGKNSQAGQDDSLK